MILTKTRQTFLVIAATILLAIPATSGATGWKCPNTTSPDPLKFDYGKGAGCEAITSSDVNLAWLRAGNVNFDTTFANLTQQSRAANRTTTTTLGQKPKAIILTCSDSRVPPEILFNKALGEIFVIRVAGNIIAKHEIGSIEYGIEHLGANLVIVLGHERCGAVQATYDNYGIDTTALGPNLNSLISSINPAVTAVVGALGNKSGNPAQVEECVIENVKMVAESLESHSAIVKESVERGLIKIVTAKFDLDDGIVSFFPSTESASSSTSTATLHGIINDNRLTTAAAFEYGATSEYGSTVSAGSVSLGTEPTEVSAGIIGLTCNTTYHYRAIGTNAYGTTSGNDKTFKTAACPPVTTPLDYSALITGATFTVTRVEAGGTPVTISSGTQTNYTDTDQLLSNTIYTYYVESNTTAQTEIKTIRTPLYRGWNIVGVPYNTVGIPMRNLFGSNPMTVYEWVPTGSSTPDNNGYYASVSQLTPGKGYFALASNTNTTVINTTGLANAGPVNVTLKPGYTLISSPKTTNISSIDSTWQINGYPDLAAAVLDGKIDNTLWWWNGTTYDSYLIDSSTVIEPWKAYWILNKDAAATFTLTIP